MSKIRDEEHNTISRSTGLAPMSDEELHRISKQHASAGAIQVASGSSSLSPVLNPDLQIAEQYMSLGKALKVKGDYTAAVTEMTKALEIRKKVAGKDHPETASTYYQLGICHTQAKNYTQALTQLKRALTLGRIVWGKQHEDTACTYYQLGIVLNAVEDYDLGLRELRKALDIFEIILGKDHEATARTFHHMGDAYVGKNDTTGALVQYGKAFIIQVSQLGRHNPQNSFVYLFPIPFVLFLLSHRNFSKVRSSHEKTGLLVYL